MPNLESYNAQVTVSVVLRTVAGEVVAEYAVTRHAPGTSRNDGGASEAIAKAYEKTGPAVRSLAAGVDNAEKARLK